MTAEHDPYANMPKMPVKLRTHLETIRTAFDEIATTAEQAIEQGDDPTAAFEEIADKARLFSAAIDEGMDHYEE